MTIQAWLLLILGPLVTVAFIWMPFGFEMSGLIEEWIILDLFTNYGLFFLTTPSSPLPDQSLRPLTLIPHAISYWLDSNSFFYWHVILIFSIFLKGLSLSFIGLRLTNSIKWGALLGVIGIIHPADTMQLCFRSLHINLALGLFIFSVCLAILANEQNQTFSKILLSIFSSFMFLISVLMYEAGIVMTLIPLIFIYIFKKKPPYRKHLIPQLCWFGAAAIYLVYSVAILRILDGTYQGAIVTEKSFFSFVFTFLKSIPKLFTITLSRSLFGGWKDALAISFLEFYSPIYLLIFTSIIGGWFFSKTYKTEEVSNNFFITKHGKLIIVGITLLILAYIPYMISGAFWDTNQRTYLFATPGASFALLGALLWLDRKSKFLLFVATLLILYSGLAFQLYQFNHYVDISHSQKNLLKSLVENFDGKTEQKTLIIFDESNKLSNLWLLRDNLHQALSYFYKKPFSPIQVCTLPGMEWQKLNKQHHVGKCITSDEKFIFREFTSSNTDGTLKNISSPDLVESVSNTIVIKIQPDGTISKNQILDEYLSNLNSCDSDQAKRYRNILNANPIFGKQPRFSIFPPSLPSDRVRWDFGRWWSLDIPIIGSGWNAPIWKFFFHKTVIWKNQEVSRLLFEMNPSITNYLIRGKINDFLDEEVKASMEIRINKTKVIFTHLQNGFFEGQVLPQSLVNGTNTVEFYSKMGIKDPNLSFSLDWLEIIPR